MLWTKQTARRSNGGKAPASLARAAVRRATKAKAGGKVAVKRLYGPATVALRDIRKFQRSGELIFSRLAFRRLVRESAQEYTTSHAALETVASTAVDVTVAPAGAANASPPWSPTAVWPQGPAPLAVAVSPC